MQPLLNTSPHFGFLSLAARQAMMQTQYGLSANDAVALSQQKNAFGKRYLGSAIPYSVVGAILGFMANRFLPKNKVNGLWVLGGWLAGNIVAGIQHWPEAKRLYAAVRDKSTRPYPAYVDALYGYRP